MHADEIRVTVTVAAAATATIETAFLFIPLPLYIALLYFVVVAVVEWKEVNAIVSLLCDVVDESSLIVNTTRQPVVLMCLGSGWK